MSSQITPEKNNTFIGNGSYGNVYKNNDIVTKVMNSYDQEDKLEFNEINMNEVMFLSTYRHVPFIPKYKSAKLNIKDAKNNDSELSTIEVNMEYCGITLEKYSTKIPYNDRLKLIPSLMTQLSRIMVWMKSQNIVHVDIKPANMCIDNDIIKLIDWGFVTRLNKKYNKSIYGTKIFCDPYTIKNKILTREYDMFSCGISLCFFLTKSYADNKWIDMISNFTADDDENNKKTIEYFLGDHIKEQFLSIPNGKLYYELLCQMINVNPEHRITPEKLYKNMPQELKDTFPILDEYNYIKKDIKYNLSVSDEIIGKAIYWMLSVKEYEKIYSSVDHAIKLLYRYLNKKDENYDIETVKLISACCLLLSAFTNSRDMYLISVVHILNYYVEEFSYNDIIYTMNDILTVLDFDTYPECELTEGLTDDIDLNKWFNLYLTYNNNGNIIPNTAVIFNNKLKLSVMCELNLSNLNNYNSKKMKQTVAHLLVLNVRQVQNKHDFDASMKTVVNLFNFIVTHKLFFRNYQKLMDIIYNKFDEMILMMKNKNYDFTRNKHSKTENYYYNKLRTLRNLM